MEKEILYKYAENSDGKIVHINDAIKSQMYYCPDCKSQFIFRKGDIRQPHFAHNNPSPNCTAEGYLHKTFKKLLLQKIREQITAKTPFEIQFVCNVCQKTHHCNILNNICDVKDEYSLEGCRPDIALIDETGKIPIIIEVVDTHAPENNVLDYCKKNSTILVIIKLDSLNDLENIENKIKSPSNVLISKLQCPNYQNYVKQQLQQQQYSLPTYRISKPSGALIDRIDAAQQRKETRRYYATKNNYKKKGRKK